MHSAACDHVGLLCKRASRGNRVALYLVVRQIAFVRHAGIAYSCGAWRMHGIFGQFVGKKSHVSDLEFSTKLIPSRVAFLISSASPEAFNLDMKGSRRSSTVFSLTSSTVAICLVLLVLARPPSYSSVDLLKGRSTRS